MKIATLSRRALCALLLSVALSGSIALAEDTAAPATNVVPITQTAPRPVDAVQTKLLQEALKGKNWDVARAAIIAGADVNAADKGGVTMLMRAADVGQSGLVELLLQNGANPNALDKKGQSALHYAIPADPKPKKKFGFGQMLGSLGGGAALGNALSASGLGNFGSLLGGSPLDSLMGSNLTSLLGGQAFNLTDRSGWTAIAGAALKGDTGGNYGIGQLLGSNNLNTLSAANWTSLLSSVKAANPQILSAMSNIGAGGTASQSALWGHFLNAASSGDHNSVAGLMQNPELTPLLQQATAGLGAAAGELPGNAPRVIVSTLLKSGANAAASDKDGKTAAALAQERGLTEFGDLFAAA